jgi:hypothetical protein
MRNTLVLAAALSSLAILLAACGSQLAEHAAAHTDLNAVVTDHARQCRAGSLVLGYGQPISPMTGEHSLQFKIVNRGQSACSLIGYPDVALFASSGQRLPFHYTDGHSMYLTVAKPKDVIVPRDGFAYVQVAKYRCDLGDVADATAVQLALPGSGHIVLTGPVTRRGFGVISLAYCKGGPADPGQTVGISPVEARPTGTGPFGR